MKVIDFRFLNINDRCNLKYDWWSRVYEYPYVLDTLDKLKINEEAHIHNSSWGFGGCHITFKNELDVKYTNTKHSDIKSSSFSNTFVYDITKRPDRELVGAFDVVINVSTVEEVKFSDIEIIKNLLDQLKNGGYLILTFDYSISKGRNSIDLKSVEEFVNKKIEESDEDIRGDNSQHLHFNYSHLKCGVLVLQK